MHDKTSRRIAENVQLKSVDRTSENTVKSNTPGASPGELILPSILDADPELADDAQAMVNDDERHQVGRPRIDRADLAEKWFFDVL